MKAFFAALAALTTVACASTAPVAEADRTSQLMIPAGLPGKIASNDELMAALTANLPIEAIYWVMAAKDRVRVRVSSNGCTKKDDFSVLAPTELNPSDKGRPVLISRIRPDPCQSLVIGSTFIEFSYSELGGGPQDRIRFVNPLIAWIGPGE